MISIIFPSRNRPKEMLTSLKSLGLEKNGLEALIWLDKDDPQLDRYKKLFGNNPNIRLFIKKRIGYIKSHLMFNFLAKQAKYDWIFEFNDDAYIENPDWFEVFKNSVKEFDPARQPVVINIWGQGEEPLNLFPIVSRKYVEILGHFSLFPACDDWIRMVAAGANVSYDLKGIKPKHRKYGGENPLRDKTFVEVQKDRVQIKKIQRPSNPRFRELLKKNIAKIVEFKTSVKPHMPSITPGDISHLPVLIKALQISEGPVLELGSGFSSTPVIHWLCLQGKRRLVTYENNLDLFEIIKSFATNRHEVRFVEDWDKIPIENEHWGVVLVDHNPPERRKIEITRLAKVADYIIVHDTETRRDKEFGFAKASFPLFKYRFNYRRQKPYTSVMSNFVDFSSFYL